MHAFVLPVLQLCSAEEVSVASMRTSRTARALVLGGMPPRGIFGEDGEGDSGWDKVAATPSRACLPCRCGWPPAKEV